MAELTFHRCSAILNSGGISKELEQGLSELFPQPHEGYANCQLKVNYDLSCESLYIDICTDGLDKLGKTESVMLLAIDGLEEIDALRRYCEMVLAHHQKAITTPNR